MGLKRITARIEVTYPADDQRSLEELRAATPYNVKAGLTGDISGTLAGYTTLGASVDPDPEPTLPDPEPNPGDPAGSVTP